MFRKRFYVKIEFQLHAITCPGVWLCKNGYLETTIKTLGYIFRTDAMEPRFPLLAHDKFTIEGYFKSVGSMEELERVLAAEQVEITLWQSGRRLAYFVGKLADVMEAGVVPKLTCAHNINVQLLMKATPAFPGIIAPKLELTANVGVRDRLGRRSSNGMSATSQRSGNYRGDFISPNFQNQITPKRNRHHSVDALSHKRKLPNCYDYLDLPRRQQPVCHAKRFNDDTEMENCSTPQYAPTTVSGTTGGLFEADGIKYKNSQRRFSACSSQSFALSQSSTTVSGGNTSEYCTHTWNSNGNFLLNADEHQERCEICQNYRKAFMDLKT